MFQYFDDSGRDTKEQWVEGVKHEACHDLNSTNSRLESISHKRKGIMTKHSSLLNFFQELMKFSALKRDYRAAMVFQKCRVKPIHNYLSQCQQLLTPYVYSFVVKQF